MPITHVTHSIYPTKPLPIIDALTMMLKPSYNTGAAEEAREQILTRLPNHIKENPA